MSPEQIEGAGPTEFGGNLLAVLQDNWQEYLYEREINEGKVIYLDTKVLKDRLAQNAASRKGEEVRPSIEISRAERKETVPSPISFTIPFDERRVTITINEDWQISHKITSD